MLKISKTEFDALRQHGEETYPYECCGVLLGQADGDTPQNRYNIDPAELIRIQREGRKQGEDIVGFYHSHPDHPARWSATDLAEAHWFGCSYVITSVEKGKVVLTNSFELTGSEEDKKLVDEKVEVR